MSMRQEDDENADAEDLWKILLLKYHVGISGSPSEAEMWEEPGRSGSRRLFGPTRLARLGTLPPMEASGDALEQVHGHSSPSQIRQSPPALRLEDPAKVGAHQRRRLGVAQLPAENAGGA